MASAMRDPAVSPEVARFSHNVVAPKGGRELADSPGRLKSIRTAVAMIRKRGFHRRTRLDVVWVWASRSMTGTFEILSAYGRRSRDCVSIRPLQVSNSGFGMGSSCSACRLVSGSASTMTWWPCRPNSSSPRGAQTARHYGRSSSNRLGHNQVVSDQVLLDVMSATRTFDLERGP